MVSKWRGIKTGCLGGIKMERNENVCTLEEILKKRGLFIIDMNFGSGVADWCTMFLVYIFGPSRQMVAYSRSSFCFCY